MVYLLYSLVPQPESLMSDTPRDQKPHIRLTTLSHGAG
jgi:hypothetical protein